MPDADVLQFHSFCLTNTGTRLDQYSRAIAKAVKAGDVVLDVGTGSGLLAFLACRAGASRVYAIESSTAVELGRRLASSAGFLERIEFVHVSSSRFVPRERVDVVVADIHDTFGLQAEGLASVFDIRERIVKPAGILIPESIQLFVAPVEAPREYAKIVDVWQQTVHAVDLSPIRPLAINQEHPARFDPSQLLCAPLELTRVSLYTSTSVHTSGTVTMTAERAGTIHGICGCFVSTLSEGIAIANIPGNSATCNFAQAFFPIERPVAVASGDAITIAIDRLDGAETRWRLCVTHERDGTQEGFDHSSFHARPLTLDLLRKQSESYHPTLNEQGAMEQALLSRLDGTRSSADLITWLTERFSELLPSEREAAAFLKSTIERCG